MSARVPIYSLPDIAVTRLLVTGGRNFMDVQYMDRVLGEAYAKYAFRILIHGGAGGADFTADQWARMNGVQPARCDALWSYYVNRGNLKGAGKIRNATMLLLNPQLVLAFPGGRGTADMREKAHKAEIPLIDLTADYEMAGA